MMNNDEPKIDIASIDIADHGTTQPMPGGIDLAAIRLSANFEEAAGVQRLLTTVPVRKPTRTEFFRVHPATEYRVIAGIIELKEERETYLVAGGLAQQLPAEVAIKCLHTCINRQGVLFLWPIRIPGSDGRRDSWSTSAARSADLATRKWTRMVANMGLGAYDVYEANGIAQEPPWPQKTFSELVQIAFADRYISTEDHPVLRQLRGEV